MRDQHKEAQPRMLGWIADTKSTGELALLNPEKYAQAMRTGRIGAEN